MHTSTRKRGRRLRCYVYTPAGLLGVLEDRAQSNSSASLAIGTAHCNRSPAPLTFA